MEFKLCLLCGSENDFKLFSSILEIQEDCEISYSEKIINIFNFEVIFCLGLINYYCVLTFGLSPR